MDFEKYIVPLSVFRFRGGKFIFENSARAIIEKNQKIKILHFIGNKKMYDVNQKTLAAALGISARQVRNLREEGMFSFIPGTKKYNLTDCVKEYIEFKVKAETGRGTSANKEKEQAEHEQLKKEITKIKLRKLRKEVHEASDIELFLNNMLLDFRNRLLSVPGKVAPEILNERDINVIINILTREMNETLDELSGYDPDAINNEGEGIEYDDEDDTDDEETEE